MPRVRLLSIPILRKLGLALALILLVLILIIGIYLWKANYHPSGQFSIQNISSKITIEFDANDIPHIKAKTSSDALFALGYLHATERSWQLEINRRIANGHLSEILGEDTVGIDRFVRTLGIKRAAEKQYENFPIESKRLIQAYADGINAGNHALSWALPIEYFLTGSKPGHWSAADSVAWNLMMALDLGGNWKKELVRLELARYLDTESIWQAMPPMPGDKPLTSVNFSKLYRENQIYSNTPNEQKIGSAGRVDSLLEAWLANGKEGLGSNNWVLSGNKTTSGKPLLANDPHLGLTAPSIWYFAHITAPDLNVIGATIPGMPGVILGRTDKLAWAFTNTNPDVQDLYIEQLNPNNPVQYRGPDGPLSFSARQEIIQIKDKPALRFIVKESHHGPILTEAYPKIKRMIDSQRFDIALRWSALDGQNQSLLAILEMNRAKSIADLQKAIRKNSAPMQNVLMADIDGNIAFQAAGIAPKRILGQGLYGVAPALGWDKQSDWNGYLGFDQLPASFNPNEGWIATANQKVISNQNPNPLTGDWDLPYRYDRIAQLISAKEKHDLNSMRVMQSDTVSLAVEPLMAIYQKINPANPLGEKALALSQQFDANMRVDSAAALIFNSWVDQLTRLLFSRLGWVFQEEYGKQNYRGALINQIQNPESPWCDIPETNMRETCQDSANIAFDRSIQLLSERYGNDPSQWLWGKAHISYSEHRPFNQVNGLNQLFNIEIPSAGDTFTINVGGYNFKDLKNPFRSNDGPSLRVIYDLSNLDQSSFIFTTGQSGWVQSKQYRNLNPKWAINEQLALTMNPEKIQRKIELNPK
ncbi:MAG: penicillin acylase family protein [Polynucleobacter sp.]|nr:penicillin acylase family protein [Polynucleobacter sp.]